RCFWIGWIIRSIRGWLLTVGRWRSFTVDRWRSFTVDRWRSFTVGRWRSFLDCFWWSRVVWIVILNRSTRGCTNSINRCQVSMQLCTRTQRQRCGTSNSLTRRPWAIPLSSQNTIILSRRLNGVTVWQRPHKALNVSTRLRFISQHHINEILVTGVFNSDNNVTSFLMRVLLSIFFGIGIVNDGAFISIPVTLDDLYRRI